MPLLLQRFQLDLSSQGCVGCRGGSFVILEKPAW